MVGEPAYGLHDLLSDMDEYMMGVGVGEGGGYWRASICAARPAL